jgi:hypothetical protein
MNEDIDFDHVECLTIVENPADDEAKEPRRWEHMLLVVIRITEQANKTNTQSTHLLSENDHGLQFCYVVLQFVAFLSFCRKLSLRFSIH